MLIEEISKLKKSLEDERKHRSRSTDEKMVENSKNKIKIVEEELRIVKEELLEERAVNA